MNKEQQDLSWACLPREIRDKIKDGYKIHLCEYKRLSESAMWNESSGHFSKYKLLEALFGKNNLTSDIEPKEMLTVERKKVQDYYDRMIQDDDEVAQGVCHTLKYFFGDKCLPDE